MRIGFVVNDVLTEKPTYTTTRLAMHATAMGHEAYLMGLGDFAYLPDGSLSARVRGGADKSYRSLERYLDDVQKPEQEQHLPLGEFDVVMLRADPADDASQAPWANNAGVAFGQLMVSTGVLVVNDPGHLAYALSKAYFQHFPEAVRPRTLISRDEEQISDFVAELGGKAVFKPLQGSGGSGVFLVDINESPNVNQIIEAIARDGYVVAQEYLEEAKNGDIRMFVMNGRPLEVDGKIAAFRRRSTTKDLRSNMSAGGKAEAVNVTDEMLHMVELVRPKTRGRRHVPRGSRHRGRQAHGGERVLPGWPRLLPSPVRRELRDPRHRGSGQAVHPQPLPPEHAQRGPGQPVTSGHPADG